jgi:hypothetical protein
MAFPRGIDWKLIGDASGRSKLAEHDENSARCCVSNIVSVSCFYRNTAYPETFPACVLRLMRIICAAKIRSSSAAGTGRECR